MQRVVSTWEMTPEKCKGCITSKFGTKGSLNPHLRKIYRQRTQVNIPQNRIVHLHFNALRCFQRFINNSMPPLWYFLLQLANMYDQLLTQSGQTVTHTVYSFPVPISTAICFPTPKRAATGTLGHRNACSTEILLYLKSSKNLAPLLCAWKRRDSIGKFVICIPETLRSSVVVERG